MSTLLSASRTLLLAGASGNGDPLQLLDRKIGDSTILNYEIRLNYYHYRPGCIMVPVKIDCRGIPEFRVVLKTAQGGSGFFEPKLPQKKGASGIDIAGNPIDWWRSLSAMPIIDQLSGVALELECRTRHRPDHPFFVMVPTMDRWGTESFVQAVPFRRA